jgi:hypothetical protein
MATFKPILPISGFMVPTAHPTCRFTDVTNNISPLASAHWRRSRKSLFYFYISFGIIISGPFILVLGGRFSASSVRLGHFSRTAETGIQLARPSWIGSPSPGSWWPLPFCPAEHKLLGVFLHYTGLHLPWARTLLQ